MRICVCGGRDFLDYNAGFDFLDHVFPSTDGMELVCGMANGADSIGYKWAKSKGNILIHKFPALWDVHGKAAGPIRNQQMVDFGFHTLVVFPGGRGTAHMTSISQKAGRNIIFYDAELIDDQY